MAMPRRDAQIPRWCRRLIDLADSAPGQAVSLALQAAALEHTPWQGFIEGWSLLCWERFDPARSRLDAARQRFAAESSRLGVLLCAYGLLLVDQRQLVRQGLDAEFATLADQLAMVGQSRLATRARLDQARQLNVLGRSRECETVLDAIEQARPTCRPLDLARLSRVRGVAAYQQGDYPRAAALFECAERRFRLARRRLEQARCWFEQGALASYQEQPDQTLACCKRAEEVFVTFDLPLQRAFCLKAAGFASIRLGQYDQALQHTRQAIELFQELGRAGDVGACTLNLGNIYLQCGSWAAALGAYTRAEEHFVAGGLVGHQLFVRRNRAMVYRALGRLAEANALLDEGERAALQLGYQAEVAELRHVQAAILADEDRIAEARERYHEAYERFVRLENSTAAAECRLELGWLALRSGDTGVASAHFAAAHPALSGRDHHAWRVAYGQGRCAELSGEPAHALGHYTEASVIVAALRRRLASEQLSSDLFAQTSRLHIDALLLATAQNNPLAVLTFLESQRALTLQQLMLNHPDVVDGVDQHAHEELRQQIEALLQGGKAAREALDSALEAYGQLLLRMRHRHRTLPVPTLTMPAKGFDLEALRRSISTAFGEDWTALVYQLIGDRLIIVSVTPEAITLDVAPYDTALRRQIERASQPAYRYYTYSDLPFLQGHTSQAWSGLITLADQLVPAHVRSRLHADHRLLVIPAGPLHLLPWSALRLDEHWLVERAVVQLLPSLTLTSLLCQPERAGGQALTIGCSTFGGRAAELPSVAAELAAVAEHWPGPCVRHFDTEATRLAVLAAMEAYQGTIALLHIASHAQLVARRGLAAHVKLWDDNLLLPELMGLQLGGALVVLSACDGAAADVLPGDEVLSLAWAFIAGGASGVVASLWPLRDDLAPTMMASFYQQLGEKNDPALALARAQRAMIIEHEEKGVSGPQVWAALQMVGG